MASKLCKWGNSLGIRLPQYIAERACLVAGDFLYINLRDSGEIVIRPVKAREMPQGFQQRDSAQEVTAPTTATTVW